MITIDSVRPSADIRDQLAAEGRPILLAFSCGKDAIASLLALRDSGIAEIVPYYLYYLPGLSFVEATLDRMEQAFGRQIHRYPHPSLYRWLNNFVFQAPERLAIIEAAQLPQPTYEQIVQLIREDLDLPPSTWVADGVRAADSIVRRASIVRHGPMKPSSGKVSVIWDWQKREVLDRIAAAGIPLPPDYEWFGRSFDGIDRRFLEPLSRHAPQDYRRVLDWFPLAELELVRHAL
jgi:3'-phosphoadenosine 5'-phosphosulfate sulfotransferase (PAPS reductase)/FAD synthetase